MANAIGRLRLMGIAAQPTFGTAAASPTYHMALIGEAPTFEPVVNKADNDAALGSAYMSNDMVNTTRAAQTTFEVKIDENSFPLLLQQRFEITSTTVAGETTVYEHTLSYTNNTNTWYTLFIQDDSRVDYVFKDVLFGAINISADQDFLRASIEAVGAMPATGDVTVTVTQPNEFVGRHTTFSYADFGSTTADVNILSATLNHTFGRSQDEDNYSLGEDDGDITTHVLTQDEFTQEVIELETNRSSFDDFVNNTAKTSTYTIESTDRFVDGSVANTRPYIQLSYPKEFIRTWTEDASLDELVKATLELKAVDAVGVTDSPMKVVVKNDVASY